MSQNANNLRPHGKSAVQPLQVLRDHGTRCFIVTVADQAWAQLPDESAAAFYTRLEGDLRRQQLPEAAAALATHRAEILAADDYVDPILYESGFFRDKAHHDEVMREVMTAFAQQQRKAS